ncbi:MAG: isoleucine--tRNA ligase [Vicinamibacteria bacterium]|jgi:isoleucyl-tRNA synthetase|nr:isoleucine--tRNA ligase [Vicinamibacteria bacterium]
MSEANDWKTTLNLPQTAFPMKANLPDSEPKRLSEWKSRKLYARVREARKGKPRWILHDGPPYANGHIHLGHVVNKTLKDLALKRSSMLGFDAPFTPVWDCHGLPIELQVDKSLGSKKKELSPVAFREACQAHAQKFVGIQGEEFERLGVSAEWDHPYFTMAPSYQATIVRCLAKFVERDLVYKARKSVHWCLSCKTALAEAEIEYEEDHISPSVDVRFPLSSAGVAALAASVPAVAGRKVHVITWTTTPWTLPANRGLAFNPELEYGLYEETPGGAVAIIATGLKDATVSRARTVAALTLGEPLAVVKGDVFEGLDFRHPWIDRPSPGVLADYVTLDAGTGIVHTAPGHGADDYDTGIKYGLEVDCPVTDRGFFTTDVEHFAGQKIWDANPKITEFMRERGILVSTVPYSHSYPICWRCKNAVIFRATAQWFIAMDRRGFREKALSEIKATRWIPGWGEDRIRNMIAARPDWCISRQRLWGVPIPAAYCVACEEPHLEAAVLSRVADVFDKEGADAWFARDIAEFLPEGFKCRKCGGAEFRREDDILDVWFDSGSMHAALEAHPDRPVSAIADLYLEGADQHRGWFHSSLLVSVGTRDHAPFKTVLTHGFTMDGEGRKMSKSLGNTVEADKAMKQYGADVLRLWVSMVDFREDMRISDELLKRVAEAYRKVRNTCRFLLSNLFDFDPSAGHRVTEPLDEYALAVHHDFEARIRKAYEDHDYHALSTLLVHYCTVDLSAFYMDVLKDRLYCDAANGPRRRSAQAAMFRIADGLARYMAPLLAFTGDEIYEALHKAPAGAVHECEFPAPVTADAAVLERWRPLLAARELVLKALETARAAKVIASPLDARIVITGPSAALSPLRTHEALEAPFPGNLANLFIVSSVVLEESATATELSVGVAKALGVKCTRCWTYATAARPAADHPDNGVLCPRCVGVVEGEPRG